MKKGFMSNLKSYALAFTIPLLIGTSYSLGSLRERALQRDRDLAEQEMLLEQDVDYDLTPELKRLIAEMNGEKFVEESSYEVLEKKHDELLADYSSLERELRSKNSSKKTNDYSINTIKPPLAIDSVDIPLGEYFIEVDKPNQRVRVWQRSKYSLVADVPTSTGLHVGEKERQGDNKSPSGYATIMTKQNSSAWEYAGEPAYGPYFFRLNFGGWDKSGNYDPNGHCSIGIHGTHEPELLGTERSHGCFRLDNDFLLEADDRGLIAPGNPVFVIPYSAEKMFSSKSGVGRDRLRKSSEKLLVDVKKEEVAYK